MIKQQKLVMSPYTDLYDLIIPKDNILRKIKKLVDFSFVYDEIIDTYSFNNGRGAIDPIMMFKYLMLKITFDLSDVDVVERSKYDMSFKYFLDIAPEASVIDPSSLTKFRKLRLKDSNMLDLLINKTVSIAIKKGILKSKSIIVDSTHTKARYNQLSPRAILVEQSKLLRKSVYEIDEEMKSKFPKKVSNGILEDQIDYCKKLIGVIEEDDNISQYPKVKEKLNLLKDSIDDDIEQLTLSKDEDAKVGHKTADTSFFGYKTHIAMSEERIITSATITSGEKHDGKELETLIVKSKKAGVKVETVIGDAAYSEKDNIVYAKGNDIKLVARLSECVTHGNRKNSNKFEFNKDAGMYVCQEGHMAFKKTLQKKNNTQKNQMEQYFFDVNKCKCCPSQKGCYKEGNKTKTYSVTILSNPHKEQIKFQESEYFQEKSKERYKIEAKNSELKHRHGYDVASATGLKGMHLQSAVTIFVVNLKRILTILDGK